MDIPHKKITILSAGLSYILVARTPNKLLFSNPTYLGTFVQLWLLQLVLFATWTVILYPKLFSPLRHLPGPTTGNSFFNGQFAAIKALPSGAPAREWVNTIPNNGLIRYLGLFNQERLLITDPKGLGEVLTTKNYDFVKPTTVRAIGRILGVGVLLAEGDEHRMQRKNLMPAFAFRHIKNLYPMFWEKSREVVLAMTEAIKTGSADTEAGQEKVDGNEKATSDSSNSGILEVGVWASRATLDIIGKAGMGKDFGAIKDPQTEICQTYLTVFKPSPSAQILGFIGLFLPFWFVRRIPVKHNGEIEAAAETIRSVCRKLIQEKKAKLEKGELADKDILSVALESGGFSDENLVDQCMTFLAAGHETTATSMTWAIYMLCRNPEVQSKLRAEIREKLPSPENADNEVGSEDIDHMPYLNAVCNEVLRYYPPVPLTLREAAVNTSILGQPIPKGTKIMLIPWATNRDASYWGDDVNEFLPERWLLGVKGRESREKFVGNGGAESNYNYMTFLHGPRSCIGQGFAKAEFATLLAAWVGRFEFELNDKSLADESNLIIKGGVTARPSQGMWVKTKIVEGW